MTSSDSLRQQLLANGPFQRLGAPYRLLCLSGPDAGDFLQRLCSQDVLGLAEGVAAPAAFLDAKGKVVATCLVQRIAGTYWLECQEHQSERLQQLLERYHFTEKLAIGVPPAPDTCSEWVALAGTTVPAVTGAVRFVWTRGGVTFVRAHADAGTPAVAFPGAPLPADLAEALRMLAGIVKIGIETDPATLALEAGLADHCSTTKGCYTGQEIVARIHTYGHTNRALCVLQLAQGSAITAPQTLHETEDQLAVGRVMAAVPAPGHDLRVGLGYLPADFQASGTTLALADATKVTVLGVVHG